MKIHETRGEIDRLGAKLTRLYSAHERADWKLHGERRLKARLILSDRINATEDEYNNLMGW